MTKDEINEMWKNSGDLEIIGMPYSMIEEAVLAEREACALLCEEERINATHYSAPTQSNWLAKKIRAR